MAYSNQLFFIGFVAAALGGCAGSPPSVLQAPVVEARQSPAVTSTPFSLPRPAAPTPGPSKPVPPPAPAAEAAAASRGDDLLFQAIAAAGIDYRNGGRNYQTGFDCSGLVAFVFREAYGLDLPHNSRAQSAYGEPVDAGNLQPGDLVFFNTQRQPYSHVGIYLGEGKFIHAPRTGSRVRTESMQTRYWATRFDGGRRIAPAIVAADYSIPRKKPATVYP